MYNFMPAWASPLADRLLCHQG